MGQDLFRVLFGSSAKSAFARDLTASIRCVLDTRAADTIRLQKSDIGGPGLDESAKECNWIATHFAILGNDQRVEYIVQQLEDVTELVYQTEVSRERLKVTEQLLARTEEMNDQVVFQRRDLDDARQRLRVANEGLVRSYEISKKTEEELRSSQDRLAAIIAGAMDAIITIDAEQRVVVFNAAAERIFLCKAADAIGRPLDRFLPVQFREAHRHHIQKFGATGATTRSMLSPGVLYGVRTNGEHFPLEATISHVMVGGERLYTVILRDITQRKQTEAALIQSAKLATVGRLAATIAHEINNPLDAVINLLYLAGASPSLDDTTREYVKSASLEVARAAQIVRQTLGFSKGGANPSTFRVASVVESVVGLLQRRFRNKAVSCEKEFLTDREICAVEGEVRQVLWNLLTNSLDAVSQRGRIKIRISATGPSAPIKGIRFTIADNGCGISRQHLAHLFEPFFTTKHTGNGLGLWVTSEIVKKYGGSIRVRSNSGPGSRMGTVFAVFLPEMPAKMEECELAS